MENQPMEQSVPPVMGQPVEKSSSGQIISGIILAVVVIGLVVMYFVSKSPAIDDSATATTEETQMGAPTEGNTTSDISADLSQIPDSSASLDSDSEVVANDVQGL